MYKTIFIITAMPEEMTCLHKLFQPHHDHKIGAFHFFESRLQNVNIVTAICGIGKVNAAICTTIASCLYQPDLVINVGVAGGLHPNLHVGDVIVASKFNYHDADATTFGYDYGQIPRMPKLYQADQELVDFLLQMENSFSFKLVAGLLSSGDSFVADENSVIIIKEKFPEILGLDMESCAIAQVCHQLSLPFCCLRSISDAADGKAKQSYEHNLVIAVENVSQVLQSLLAKYLQAEPVLQ
jgi:adenosylhomocysteine nucleosidase